jgi:hypothetical protein
MAKLKKSAENIAHEIKKGAEFIGLYLRGLAKSHTKLQLVGCMRPI